MLPEDLASFPFLDAAAEYVSSLDFTLDALIRSKVFEPARKRGFDRLVGAMNGYIEKPSLTSENEVLTELLSYPYARILVSCPWISPCVKSWLKPYLPSRSNKL